MCSGHAHARTASTSSEQDPLDTHSTRCHARCVWPDLAHETAHMLTCSPSLSNGTAGCSITGSRFTSCFTARVCRHGSECLPFPFPRVPFHMHTHTHNDRQDVAHQKMVITRPPRVSVLLQKICSGSWRATHDATACLAACGKTGLRAWPGMQPLRSLHTNDTRENAKCMLQHQRWNTC
jgi:hypothetical protein